MVTVEIEGEKISLESLLADFKEIREMQRELQKENAERQKENDERQKEIREMQKETAESQKETARQMKETDKRLGLYDNRYGQMLEYMVQPNLIKGFREFGFVVTKAYKDTRITDDSHKTIAEIDFTLEDGNKVILVEIKSRFTTEDVSSHVERIAIVKNHASQRGDRRSYFGAIGGLIINENERDFALKTGFYVIQPSGETFDITAPVSPREW